MVAFENMTWREYQRFVRAEAREQGIPAFGTFELTPLCNFSCKMCYVRLAPERMRELGRLRTAAEWLDMADQAQEAGLIGITLTGGEVLTRPDFTEIYTGLVDRGIVVSVLSNGSLIDDGLVEVFRSRPPAHMRFTLYGASNATYGRLCGAPDGFDRVMHGLHLLKDAGIGFTLSMTETTLNIDDYDTVNDIARELDVPIVFSANLVPAVRGARSDLTRLQVRRGRYPRPTTGEREGRPDGPSPSDDGPFGRCSSYGNSFWIDWNGSMELCAFMSSCRTQPFTRGFTAAWRDLRRGLERIRLPRPCQACAVRSRCPSCPGTREAQTGSPEKACPQVCHKVHGLVERMGDHMKGEDCHEEEV